MEMALLCLYYNMKKILILTVALLAFCSNLFADNPTIVNTSTGLMLNPPTKKTGNITIQVDPASSFWGTFAGANSVISKKVGALYTPLIINPEHNSVGGSTTNNLAVILDFTQFTATNTVLAWGAYSSDINSLQEFYRGASLQIPVTVVEFGVTALVVRVWGSTSSPATNVLDLLITDPATGNWFATNGLTTATAEEWTSYAILKAGTMFTNAMPGKTINFRINPYCWAGTTTALDSVVQVIGQ